MTNSARGPMNILMASGVSKRHEGGVAGMIYNLGRELERRGNQVTYLFQEDLVDSRTTSSRFVELIFSRRLARHIARHRGDFDVVNLHAPVGFPYGLRRRLLGPRGYPPYVMTLHGLEERRVHVMKREARKGRAWHFSWKNRLWHRAYTFPRFRWSIRTADGAHTISRDVWNLLQLKYDMDADHVAYIPNGVESRFLQPREYRSGRDLRLLYVGSWLDQRAIFYIRDALRSLATRLPGMTMTFAGCGVPDSMITGFFGAELASRILVRPVVPSEKMHELYAEHDVFLFPSLLEGFPSVLLEAMASAMPVITTDTCGMPDVVQNECNGLLIPPADSDAIAAAVLQLAESEELRRRLGCRAQETVKQFSWERSAQQLERFFQHIAALEGDAS